MARKHISPADCLDELPEPELEFTDEAMGDSMRRIELRRSILAIAELDHPAETALVTAVAKNRKEGKAKRRG
ncbi:hypothetical protein AB0A63_34595 [Lentzea sp. NPDC042327]|uniref:hypothetical protein n=1 Tax=Lentzea sp. NPDC042327 TaxID=3154801 RepID=UPI00340024F7